MESNEKMEKREDQNGIDLLENGKEVIKNNHIIVDNGIMKIFAVSSKNKIFYGGSYNQFSGNYRTAIITLGVMKKSLDSSIKRVGFMGIDNNNPLQIEVKPEAEYENGLWDINFEIYRYIMGQENIHNIKGSFYVETINETYYWLKYKKSLDFKFDSFSRFMLCDFE